VPMPRLSTIPNRPTNMRLDTILLLNRDLRTAAFTAVMRCVRAHKAHEKLVLILVTYGGQPNVAYRIARFLQTAYQEIVAFVPSECKSARTLMVSAAKTVVLSPFGEIGPMDVQLLQRDEIFGRRSGLTTRSALSDLKVHTYELFEHFMTEIVTSSSGAVSFRLAAEISARVSSRLMSKIYEQINPDALGQDLRDLNIADKYCERLNRRFRNLKPEAVHRLIHDYPSHDFVIDFEEAKEIFENVELPTPTLIGIMQARGRDIFAPKTGAQFYNEMVTSSGEPIKADVDEKKPTATTKSTKPARERANATAIAAEKRRNGNGAKAAP
jgi:hypothetical protein